MSPKLVGDRFANHTVPLELFKDFAALQEMLVEVAKWEFIRANPGRERTPRNFTSELDLHLEAIEDGSAILKIALVFGSLFPSSQITYFEQAREDIVATIAAVQTGQQPTLPAKYLSYFDRFGRGLRTGEAISFPHGSTTTELTPDVRNSLMRLAEVKEWSEEVALRVRIPEADKARKSFEMELPDGTKLSAPLAVTYRDVVLQAFDKFETGSDEHVFFQGAIRKDRDGHLKGIESIEHISQLDPLDVTVRLDALSKLEDGWLDGQGAAFDKAELNRISKLFETHFTSDLPLPFIYPAVSGELQSEWNIDNWSISLEIKPSNLLAEFQALELSTEECQEFSFNLDDPGGWARLNSTLKALIERPSGGQSES